MQRTALFRDHIQIIAEIFRLQDGVKNYGNFPSLGVVRQKTLAPEAGTKETVSLDLLWRRRKVGHSTRPGQHDVQNHKIGKGVSGNLIGELIKIRLSSYSLHTYVFKANLDRLLDPLSLLRIVFNEQNLPHSASPIFRMEQEKLA